MLSTFAAVLLLQAAAPDADQQLLAVARAATVPYHDRAAAVRAGYRRLGPELPEMGEHWINPIAIVEARYDPARPAVLTYATIGGKPTLTGVAYALALRRGEAPPPTGVSGAWHDHSATVDAELAGAHHRGSDGARVVLMHAWVWLQNPAGTFADANWLLPFARAGVQPPLPIDPEAARAISVVFDNGAYYAKLLRVAGFDDAAPFSDLIVHVRQVVGSRTTLTKAESAALARAWRVAVEQLARGRSAADAHTIRALLGSSEP